MKKYYSTPACQVFEAEQMAPILALSPTDGTDVPVNPGEGHDPGESLNKEGVFDFDWD